jgi:hypothetical protein
MPIEQDALQKLRREMVRSCDQHKFNTVCIFLFAFISLINNIDDFKDPMKVIIRGIFYGFLCLMPVLCCQDLCMPRILHSLICIPFILGICLRIYELYSKN